MRDKKATGDDDVPGDILKLLGADDLILMTQLINSIYVTGEWPRDFIEVTLIALKKKPKATKCNNHHTISIITHAAKIVARILRRKIEKRGKGTRDAIGMLRIISEQTLVIDEELCACFIDWQNAFDCVKWTKLMQIIKGIGIDWHERRLISKLYMEQSVKI
jgi:hypothetical protein